ncbi:hypothetical protein ABPG74_010544 [Tetrahymena malaccensis]
MRTHIISNQILSDRQVPSQQLRPQSAKIYGQRAIPYNPQQQISQGYSSNYEVEDPETQSSRVFKPSPKIAYTNRSGSANRSVPKKPIMNNYNINNNSSFNNGNELGYTEYNKHLPKQIFYDKEKLYQETLQLKSKINDVSQENLKLKTRLNALEKETAKMERLIEEMELNGTYKNHFSKNSNDQAYLIANLKKNLKQNKMELEFKQDEINKLKKSVKFTRIQELEAEKKAFSDETIRLKHLLDQALYQRMNLNIPDGEIKAVEEKYYQQNNLITQLRKENAELAQAIKNLEDQNYHLQQSYQDVERKNQKEVQMLKKILKEKEKELNEQRGDIDKYQSSPNQKNFSKNISQKREENSKMNQENKHLRDQINQKQRTIGDLEKKMQETQLQYRDLLEKEKDENNVLKQELEKELKLNQNLRERLKASEKNKNESYLLQDTPVDFTSKKLQERTLPSHIKAKHVEKEHNQEKKEYKKRVEIVTLDDIKETGEELNYRFRSQGLDWDEIIQIIFPNIDDESDIPTLKKIVQEEPFNIKDEKMSEFISRYCIENNTYGNWMFLDLSKKCSNHIIKSILRQIVGPYRLLTQEESQKMFDYITEVITAKRAPLNGFMKEKGQKRGHLKKEEIIEVFTMCEADLNKDQIDYIITSIIIHSEDIQKLQYQKIFDIFQPNQQASQYCIYNKENMDNLYKIKNKGNIKNQQDYEESDDDFKDLTETEREAMRRHDELVANQNNTDEQHGIQNKTENKNNHNQDLQQKSHQFEHTETNSQKLQQKSEFLEQPSKHQMDNHNQVSKSQMSQNHYDLKENSHISQKKDNNNQFSSNQSSKQNGSDPLLESKGYQDGDNNYYEDEEQDDYEELDQHNEIKQEDVSDAHIEI